MPIGAPCTSCTQEGAWLCPEGLPAHLNLAKFLSNSCFSRWKSWMYFIWEHEATREVERDVSTGNGQADTSLSALSPGHPSTPKGLGGSPAHQAGPAAPS